MEEKTFLNEGGVMVTNARFVVSAQTYAMSGITSIKSVKQSPSMMPAVFFIVIGICTIYINLPTRIIITNLFRDNGILCGVGFFMIGIAYLLIKAEYSVILSTASGEVKALTSKNKDFILRIVEALNQAIITRG